MAISSGIAPPYLRLYRQRLDTPHPRTCWVLIGSEAQTTAGQWADPTNNHRPFLMLPEQADPFVFDWSPLAIAPPPVAVLRCGTVDGAQCRDLITALLNAGVLRILDWLEDTNFIAEALADHVECY